MNYWSEEKQNDTLENYFPGAWVKNAERKKGILTATSPKIIIKGYVEGAGNGFLGVPSNEIIAEFDSVQDMVDADWVLD
ncbi:MAG: hypothetical protein IJU92_04515 [Spirochaetaceae bacterium]|nr:hypothetical protein [Spirochaetaceae bacterium]